MSSKVLKKRNLDSDTVKHSPPSASRGTTASHTKSKALKKNHNFPPALEDEFNNCGEKNIQQFSVTSHSIHTVESVSKIAIYGLSADPPTGTLGHRGVASYIVSLGEFSELLILPVYQHPFRFSSKRRKLAPYEDRVRMCELNFVPLSTDSTPVKVSLLEKVLYDKQESLHGQTDSNSPLSPKSSCVQEFTFTESASAEPLPSSQTGETGHASSESISTVIGTVDVVKEILSKSTDPDLRIHLVLGSDTYNDLTSGKWKSGDSLLELVDIEVIVRPGVELDGAHAETTTGSQSSPSDTRLSLYAPFGRRHRIHRLACLGEVSSTQVRNDLGTISLLSSGHDDKSHSETEKQKLISECETRLEAALDAQVLSFLRKKELYSVPL